MQNQNKKLNGDVEDGLKTLHKLRARDKSDLSIVHRDFDVRIENSKE